MLAGSTESPINSPPGHGHRPEPSQQASRGAPIPGEPKVPAHHENRVPSLPGFEASHIGKSDIAFASSVADGNAPDEASTAVTSCPKP